MRVPAWEPDVDVTVRYADLPEATRQLIDKGADLILCTALTALGAATAEELGLEEFEPLKVTDEEVDELRAIFAVLEAGVEPPSAT